MTEMTFCHATENDRFRLEAFLLSVFGEEHQGLLKSYLNCSFSKDYRRPTFLIAQIDGSIVAAAAISEELFTLDVWGISWVAVAQKYQGQGFGQRICLFCTEQITRMAQRNVTAIVLTYPDKTGLYDRLGFIKGSKDHHGGIFMTKKLVFHG